LLANLPLTEPPTEGEDPAIVEAEGAPTKPSDEVDPGSLCHMDVDTTEDTEAMNLDKTVEAETMDIEKMAGTEELKETEGPGIAEMTKEPAKTTGPSAASIIRYQPKQQFMLATKKLADDNGLGGVVRNPTTEDFRGALSMKGDDSSGKSSIVARTLGMTLTPSSLKTSTRLPTVIHHTFDATCDPPRVTSVQLPQIKRPDGTILSEETELEDLTEEGCFDNVKAIYDLVRDELGESELCKSEIIIHVQSSRAPTITIIDIPGLVNGSTDGGIDKTSEEIAKKYSQKKEFSHIVTESAQCDAPGKTIKFIRNAKRGKPGWKDRIIVVLTKIDKAYDPNFADYVSEDGEACPKTSPYYKLSDRLKGEIEGHNKEVFKELAEDSRIYGLRNKDTRSIKTQSLTIDGQVHAEEKWISENITDTGLHNRLGIKAYAKALDNILLFHLQDYLLESLDTAKSKKAEVLDQLGRLGISPSELDLTSLQNHTATTLENLRNDTEKMSELGSTLQFNGTSVDITDIKEFYVTKDFTVNMIKDTITAAVRSVFKADTEGQFRLCRFDALLYAHEERVGYLVGKHFESFEDVANSDIKTFDTLVRLGVAENQLKTSNLHNALGKALVKFIIEPVLKSLHSEVDIEYPDIWNFPPTENDADARAQYQKQLEALTEIVENWEKLILAIPPTSDDEPRSPAGKAKRKAAATTRSASKAPKL